MTSSHRGWVLSLFRKTEPGSIDRVHVAACRHLVVASALVSLVVEKKSHFAIGRPGTTYLNAAKPQRRGGAKMAFFRQNGWCLNQPSWGECHGDSMAVSDQVCESHRLHA